MISEKAFEKFLDKEFDEFPDCGYELLYMAWQACEEYYESRQCKTCQYFKTDALLPYCKEINDLQEVQVSEDFSCKYWEPKE